MAQLNPPRLRVGGLSSKVYIITHGKEVKTARGTFLDASRKYDATADFEYVARQLGWSPPVEGEVQVNRQSLIETDAYCRTRAYEEGKAGSKEAASSFLVISRKIKDWLGSGPVEAEKP